MSSSYDQIKEELLHIEIAIELDQGKSTTEVAKKFGVKFEDFEYEGYGPHSVAILIEVMTDNKNRTFPEIKSIMTKNGGNLGESGCVNWMFEKKGIFTLQINNIEEDKLMELLENSDVEDIIFDDNLPNHFISYYTPKMIMENQILIKKRFIITR